MPWGGRPCITMTMQACSPSRLPRMATRRPIATGMAVFAKSYKGIVSGVSSATSRAMWLRDGIPLGGRLATAITRKASSAPWCNPMAAASNWAGTALGS
ncbi:hypothetical protein D3C80_1301420 [compost metagenome]